MIGNSCKGQGYIVEEQHDEDADGIAQRTSAPYTINLKSTPQRSRAAPISRFSPALLLSGLTGPDLPCAQQSF